MTTITKKQAEAAERVCQELGYLDYYSPAQLRAYLDAYLSSMNVDVVHAAIGPIQGQLVYEQGLTIGPPDLAAYPRTTEDPDVGVCALW